MLRKKGRPQSLTSTDVIQGYKQMGGARTALLDFLAPAAGVQDAQARRSCW